MLWATKEVDMCDKSALMEADKSWAMAAAEKNLADLMAFYHNRASLLPPGAPPVEGKEKIRKRFRKQFADPDFYLTWSVTKASVSKSCDLAYTRGISTVRYRNEQGKLVEAHEKYVAVWVRSDDGEWLVLEDIYNRGT